MNRDKSTNAKYVRQIKTKSLLTLLSGLYILTGSLFANNVIAQDGCKYLSQYMAPFELPVDNWPTAMAGPKPGVVEQRLVGPEECTIVAEKIIHNAHGVPYRQITVAISGTVFGYTTKNSLLFPPIGSGVEGEGDVKTFADHVFYLQAAGNMGPFVPGVAQYQYTEDNPSSVEILIPQNPTDWNGNMWVLLHGAMRFSPLEFYPRQANQFNRYTEASESAGALMDMGSAVVWTRRDANGSAGAGEAAVSLDDGTKIGGPGKIGMGLNNSLGLIRDYTVISRAYIEEQLGERPKALFFRGHSAGGATGRSFLLIRGMNTDHQGEKLFHGYYLDDTAGGRGAATNFWDAKVIDEIGSFKLTPTEKDLLTFDEDQMRFMTPVIEVIHAAYVGGNTSTLPRIYERIPATYTQYKRENARINIEKGLGDTWKSYEIADVGHFDATFEAADYPEVARDMIDIGGVAIALELVLVLVDWVLSGKNPPESRVDAADVWELDPDAGPAIQLPDTACPRGVYRADMNRPDGTSGGARPALFVPYLTEPRPQINENQDRPSGFQEEWLEPLNRFGHLVDMTGSGQRMTRPTIQQIWHVRYRDGKKTGVLRPYEKLTRATYVECVSGVVADLRADGLLTQEAEKWYIEKAKVDIIGVD